MPPSKYHGVCFVLAWVFSGVDILNSTSLENTDFPLSSWCQLQMVSWFEVGPHIHLTLLVLGPCDYTGWLICTSKISHADSYFFLKSF